MPPRPVSLAAAVVLWRRAPALEVHWVQRRDELAYLGGFHAFPGGRVARADREVAIDGVEDAEARALLACAVRETFEETGVLLARGARRVAEERRVEARRRMLAEDLSLAAFLAAENLSIDARDFVPAGRWVSPPFTPGGFDTQFFLCELPDAEIATFDPGELQAGEWLAAGEALGRWRAHRALLAAPALYTLRELDARPDATPRQWGEALATTPEARGGAVPRIEVHPGFVLVPQRTPTLAPATHTNCLLIGGPEILVVDPGSDDPAELAALDAAIDRLLAEGRRVHGTLVTHHHGDHWKGVAHVRARHGGPVYAHEWTAGKVGADTPLKGGETIELEAGAHPWRLEVLFTPGHTPGHLALHEPVSGTIVAGDLVSGLSTVVIDPPEGDMAAYLASIEALLERPATLLLPGHGPPIGGPRHRLRFYLKHRAWREEKVEGALGEGPRALGEIVPVAYDDTPPERHALAERSALAHLLKLEKDGRVARTDDGRWTRALRTGAAVVALLVGGMLGASCSDEESPLAPVPPAGGPDTTTSMLHVEGQPRVSVSLEGNLVEPGSGDPLGGSFRAILEDTTGARVFLPVVRMNGVALVDQLDGFGNPSQSTLDVATALPGLSLADTLVYAVEDGGVRTPPFRLVMPPSRVELLPDSTIVARNQSLTFRWSGRIERLILTLTDQFGVRVRANLVFEGYSGLRQITLPARDLAPLAPGPLGVAASITDNEARFAGPRLVSLTYLSTQRRTWILTPAVVP